MEHINGKLACSLMRVLAKGKGQPTSTVRLVVDIALGSQELDIVLTKIFQLQKLIKEFDQIGRAYEATAMQTLLSVTGPKLGATNRQFGWLRSFFLPAAHKEWSSANERLDKTHQYQTALNLTGQSLTQRIEEIQTIRDQLRRFNERTQALPGGDTSQIEHWLTGHLQRRFAQEEKSYTPFQREVWLKDLDPTNRPPTRKTPPGISAWIRSLAAQIPWLRPHLPTPATQNTTFASLITNSSTSLTSLNNYSIHLYRTHILSYYSRTLAYYSRTTRYLAAVRAYEERHQVSRLTLLNETSESPSTAISLKPTRQELIQEIALQAGFQPGEVVPYPALWVEPWVRGYERGSFYMVHQGWRGFTGKMQDWYWKLKMVMYGVLVLLACWSIRWLRGMLEPVIEVLKWGLTLLWLLVTFLLPLGKPWWKSIVVGFGLGIGCTLVLQRYWDRRNGEVER
ncbi:MAG: hypothetical protein Q9176_003601 [Flavoplaca citrina]